MAKYTDAIRDAIITAFNAGDQPTEAQFTNWITRIQEGIEEHDHDGTGDGDGRADLVLTAITGPSTTISDNWWVGLGIAKGQIKFFDLALDELKVQLAALSCPAQPSVSAYLTANQTIPTGVVTIVALGSELWDVNGDFNTGTYTFTAPLAGKYLVCASVLWEGLANPGDGELYNLLIYKNGVAVKQKYVRTGAAGGFVMALSAILDLAATNTVDMRVSQAHGANRYLYNGALYTFMDIHKIA